MSDAIKHECGIVMLRLKKDLNYYVEKYGTALYGVNKMYLLMEKQFNRGQDGAGLANIKFDMNPGQRYISRQRSISSKPIQDILRPGILPLMVVLSSVLVAVTSSDKILELHPTLFVFTFGILMVKRSIRLKVLDKYLKSKLLAIF